MSDEKELKINARGLSAPGARLMAETALDKGPCRAMRVVVSEAGAVDDLKEFFVQRSATVKIDQVGDDFHVFAEFEEN